MAGIRQTPMVLDFPTFHGERLNLTDLPRGNGFDQQLLRDLRTSQPDMETEPAPA